MAGTLSTPQIGMGITAQLTGTSGPSSNTSNVQDISTATPTVGSAAGNVNKIYSAAVTIAASGSPASLDLTSLLDPQGSAITFATVYAIKVTNTSTVAGQDVTVGGGTTPIVANVSDPLYAGTDPGCFLQKYGSVEKTVDSTHKLLAITIAAGTNVIVNVTIIGK